MMIILAFQPLNCKHFENVIICSIKLFLCYNVKIPKYIINLFSYSVDFYLYNLLRVYRLQNILLLHKIKLLYSS